MSSNTASCTGTPNPPTHTPHPIPHIRTHNAARLFAPLYNRIMEVSWAFAQAKAQYVWNLVAKGKIKARYAQELEGIIAFSWIRSR